ncbi:hypothetical protein ACSHT0_09820 [Tepidicaulis sp. LMO-SS28]|uniref:hypothetical protein n=1 Tax=Tepidicaulis sp. LMO-SS28 TaxID=3447455 RepID=UPI003EE1CAC6
MKALQVIEAAFRGSLEEQDDTIVWLTHSMHGAGASLSVLLRGAASAYAVPGQDARGLRFGSWTQTHPPRIDREIEKLVEKGIPVYAVREDLERRGFLKRQLIEGITVIPQHEIARLFGEHDQIWHW